MTKLFNLHEIATDHARLKPQHNQFLLIDLAGCQRMAEKILYAKIDWCELLEPKRNNIATAAPIIISIVQCGTIQVSKAACSWLTECVIDKSIASVISTPLAMMDLRMELERRTHARLSGDIEIFLRFFDPRVFESLLITLTTEQLDSFLAVSDAWGYVNRFGEFKNRSTTFSQNEDSCEPLTLSQKQEDKLMDLAAADNIIYFLRKNASAVLDGIPLRDQYMSVSRACALAALDKIESMPAIVLYVSTILLRGDNIRKKEGWEAFLDMLRTGECSEAHPALLE